MAVGYRLDSDRTTITRLPDGLTFPHSDSAPEWADYFAWLQAGGTPEEGAAKDPVPEKVSQTQFMRASVQMKLVTGDEAEAYLATGTLPAFVSKPLDDLPDNERADARLKAIGATEFFRSDALFALLVASGAATADQVDALFRLADRLT